MTTSDRLTEQLRDHYHDREPADPDFTNQLTNQAADEIERLRRQIDVEKSITGLLRSQLRVLGYIPMVVETDQIGKEELKMRHRSNCN